MLVTEDHVGERLDQYLASQLPEYSRATIQKLIKAGAATVDGKVQKASYSLREDEIIELEDHTKPQELVLEKDLPVIYEDDDCLVIDKPIGVLTHSKGAYNPEPTVATFVQKHSDRVEGERSGIVHRLDRATSGVMICAKTPESLSWLQKQFSKRNVKKTYIALINGQLDPPEAVIDMPIERNPKKPQTFRVGANGKVATTHYKTEVSNNSISLIVLKPVTGRTHQLRVHLKHLGHPIIGDTLYDGSQADRLYLHAHELEITLPDRSRKTFKSKIPESFMAALK